MKTIARLSMLQRYMLVMVLSAMVYIAVVHIPAFAGEEGDCLCSCGKKANCPLSASGACPEQDNCSCGKVGCTCGVSKACARPCNKTTKNCATQGCAAFGCDCGAYCANGDKPCQFYGNEGGVKNCNDPETNIGCDAGFGCTSCGTFCKKGGTKPCTSWGGVKNCNDQTNNIGCDAGFGCTSCGTFCKKGGTKPCGGFASCATSSGCNAFGCTSCKTVCKNKNGGVNPCGGSSSCATSGCKAGFGCTSCENLCKKGSTNPCTSWGE